MSKPIKRKKKKKKGRREATVVIILLLISLVLESHILVTIALQVFKVSARVMLEKLSNL